MATRYLLLAQIWAGKITRDHPELVDHLDAVIQTVASPEDVEPDAIPPGPGSAGAMSGPAAG
jgi:hypothetical protein